MKNITIEVLRGEHSLVLKDPLGNFSKNIPSAALFTEMVKITRFYNNHQDGCIGVSFTVEE
jgi:hypothetical protein